MVPAMTELLPPGSVGIERGALDHGEVAFE
jgi:hypothetical protein